MIQRVPGFGGSVSKVPTGVVPAGKADRSSESVARIPSGPQLRIAVIRTRGSNETPAPDQVKLAGYTPALVRKQTVPEERTRLSGDDRSKMTVVGRAIDAYRQIAGPAVLQASRPVNQRISLMSINANINRDAETGGVGTTEHLEMQAYRQQERESDKVPVLETADEASTFVQCAESEKNGEVPSQICGLMFPETWGSTAEDQKIASYAEQATVNGKLDQTKFYELLKRDREAAA